MQELLPQTGSAVRVGITGVPGVGKSTTIDALGMLLTARATRSRCWRSIRPRRAAAARSLPTRPACRGWPPIPNAFVRPSPASGTLGGVAAKTRETMLLCEAAGYDVVLVETIGTGQSETVVADMTDFFLVLMLPGAGDELQGLKKGVVELADMLAVNKADGDNVARAQGGRRGLSRGTAYHRAALAALDAAGHDLFGADRRRRCGAVGQVLEHRERMTAAGEFAARRRAQQVKWMWAMLEERLMARLRSDPAAAREAAELEAAVAAGRASPGGGGRRDRRAVGL